MGGGSGVPPGSFSGSAHVEITQIKRTVKMEAHDIMIQ